MKRNHTTQSITIKGLSDLPEAAEAVLAEAEARGATVVAFYGAMGAGKTTLIREICRARGVDVQEVTSPSFAIVNAYQAAAGGEEAHDGGETIYHFDFYRIRSVEEAYDFGYEEYFFGGELCLVEWPEMVEELLPAETMRIRLTELDEDTRLLEFE